MREPFPERAQEALQALLLAAGRMALDAQVGVAWASKADGSPVSEADKAIDAFLAEGLTEAFPGMGVVGEEGASRQGEKGTFFVDPIDGTEAYLQRLAQWGPTVTAVIDGRVDFGAFYAPAVDEFWFVARGHGAWRNGVRLPMLSDAGPAQKQVIFVPSRFHQGPRVDWKGKVRALGSTAAHLAHVAGGAGVAAIIPKWSLWDVGCGALMIEEVGGKVCGFDGRPVDLVAGPVGLPLLAGASTALQMLTAELVGRIDVGR